MIYLVVFLGSMAVDLIPVVAPPAWTLMTFLLVKYHLNPWLVLAAGVPGSALGRFLFSLYIPKFSDKVLARRKKDDLRYAAVDHRALTAAGITKVPVGRLIPPFLAGKFISDAAMVMAGRYAVGTVFVRGDRRRAR